MNIAESYKTLLKASEGSYKEKGSKFLAFAYPIKTEEDVKEILFRLKKKYHDARHHCYAYKIGTGEDQYRANDDGEPSGTAGKPILGQIRSAGLTNVIIVVIRYFGGTLLGTGGLIRSYRTAAANSISTNNISEIIIKKWFRIHFKYPQINEVMKILKEGNIKPHDPEYGEQCKIAIAVPLSGISSILNKMGILNDLSINEIEAPQNLKKL